MMSCPEEIGEIIIEILKVGLVEIRASGWNGKSRLSATEADHLHNPPTLLERYSPELLLYDWGVERPSSMNQVKIDRLVVWEPLWRRLKDQMQAENPSRSAK
jgi:hypothetical protein